MIFFFLFYIYRKYCQKFLILLSLIKIVKLVIFDFQALFWSLVQYEIQHTYTEQGI